MRSPNYNYHAVQLFLSVRNCCSSAVRQLHRPPREPYEHRECGDEPDRLPALVHQVGVCLQADRQQVVVPALLADGAWVLLRHRTVHLEAIWTISIRTHKCIVKCDAPLGHNTWPTTHRIWSLTSAATWACCWDRVCSASTTQQRSCGRRGQRSPQSSELKINLWAKAKCWTANVYYRQINRA